MAESQYICPACAKPLTLCPAPSGVRWECESCSRWMESITTLKKRTNFSFISQLRQDARAAQPGQGGLCPVCKAPMAVVMREAGAVCFQVCVFCEMIWMGKAEIAAVPASPAGEAPLPLKAVEVIARADMRMDQFQTADESPIRSDRNLFWLLGVPAYPGGEYWERFPWMTLLLVLSTLGFNGLSGFYLRPYFPNWEWNPSLWPGGVRSSLIPIFFIQGGISNLILSLYLLFLLGTSVENKVGPFHLLALYVLPSLAGDLVSFALDTHTGWVVGGSGGVAGVLAFFLFAFPRKKFFWYYGGFQAGYAIGLWFLFEIFGGFQPNIWFSSLVYSAHLGGALCGWVYWFFMRKSLGPELNREEGLWVQTKK